ncbi:MULTISPECIES: hypothetical protein [Bacteria]|uniref:Uncharacterized protein n=1 Tax=Sandarakinorhabdus fusca TaxID=1439888 RepID=A0A7C9KKE2_9SPHN|nr:MULTISPECIES: hypothetical protein [Bacteria]KAB7643572.1 hypothetical protein F9290_15940 [Polymorphobacter fuscus]MQT18739.1 hypothetical protein [Polymorphobacter fuscus]
MALFNFGGQTVDSSDADALAQAAQDAGATFGGSIVAGNTYGVSGGVVTGTVHGDEQHDA